MKYSEVVKAAKKKVSVLDAAKIKEHIAIEFDVEGEGEGAFYAEFDGGKAHVEPYDYHDNDIRVRGSADEILKLLDGGYTIQSSGGRIRIEGDPQKAALLERVLEGKRLTTSKTEVAMIGTTRSETAMIGMNKDKPVILGTSKSDSVILGTTTAEGASGDDTKAPDKKKDSAKTAGSKKSTAKKTTAKKTAAKKKK